MKGYSLSADNVVPFISHLMGKKKVIAPHKKADHSFTFQEVEEAGSVALNYPRTLNSIKKFFLPMRETLLKFNRKENTCEQPEILPSDAIFLGVHNYDLKATFKLDYNFTKGNPEKNYLTRRQGAIFIGVSFTPDKFHFSHSVNIEPDDTEGFDMFLHATNSGYIVETITEAGEELINGFSDMTAFDGEFEENDNFSTALYAPQAKLSKVLDESYDNPVWKEMAEKCVSCGTCNLVCPTCYCFNVEDHMDLSLESGVRERHMDACMLRGFTEVAGNEVFREHLADRIRHRIYRKFKYISDETNEPWCVGCGRCTIYCTAGISIVDIVNRLVSDYDKQQAISDSDLAVALG